MRDLEISNMVVTYQNAKHLEYLTNQCVKYLVMPQCVEAIRPLIKKENDVLISGQMDPSFFDPNDMSNPCYVTRTRISNALRRALPEQTTLLQYPGMVLSEAWHARVGVGYLETLDRFRLAVVCKASKYDRFVGKYVEMGASHVLPVGDCPSYMPTEMKRAMLDVETMSDVDAITEIKRLIASPAELKQRSDVYSNEVGKRYLSLPNIRCLLWDMLH
jgi:hypothetical protein